MPLVNVMVNARAYTIACDEGEEAHLKELAAHVDEKVRELAGSVGQVGDQKLMLMAAVLITDELFEARGRVDGHAKASKELAGAKADFEARVAEAEKRAADAIKEAEMRAAQAVGDMEQRVAEAEARVAEITRQAEGKGASASAEAQERAALELDEAAARLERLVERLNAA
ncbi:MAG TPA: cell division protein ZapA [Rhizomicrobium sp.]|jgi:cell division protein ZapA|nr:cell division protein ZapA [Rhizomicrobium sp.]